MATYSSILACDIPWTEELGRLSPWGCKESETTIKQQKGSIMCFFGKFSLLQLGIQKKIFSKLMRNF